VLDRVSHALCLQWRPFTSGILQKASALKLSHFVGTNCGTGLILARYRLSIHQTIFRYSPDDISIEEKQGAIDAFQFVIGMGSG
jgi:hypothetical protein